MPDDGVAAAGFHQHSGRDLSGERALLFPENVLRGNADSRTFGGFYRRRDVGERRRDYDVAIAHACHQRFERSEKHAGLRLILVHLPIAGDYPATFGCAHLLVNASTPGSLRPPRNSSDAPPPVEI